ncbi:HK97 gp10 family phage protein [Virgibacillus sp. CBA3643]|uniref:HK97 gp10 family phage protein n=1 Tax=Virgibacillus sp. CBA3643 TaxID=2942278 RepID=UPI0035A3434E
MKNIDLSELSEVFVEATKNAEKMAEEVVNTNAEDLLNQSIDLAPLDEGGLRENGSVDPAKKEGNEIAAYVGYSKEYALRMHEDVYNAQVAGTGRKYLEKPTTKNAQKYADHFTDKMGDVWK